MIKKKEGEIMDDIVIVGTSIIDQVMTLKASFSEFGCNKVDQFIDHGGSMRNIAETCAMLKLKTDFISKFGNDDNALAIINRLSKLNVNVYGPTIDLPTPVFMKIEGDKELMFATTTPAFMLNTNDNIPVAALKDHQYGITDNSDSQFLSYMVKHSGQTKWVISSYIPDQAYFDKIEGVILNLREFNALTSSNNIEEELLKLHQKGLSWIIVTLGEEGCVYLHESKIHYVSTDIKKGFTLGCGDAFTSGIIYGLCKSWSIHKAIELANKLASLTLDCPNSVCLNTDHELLKDL